jgi:hypothetical protein
MYVPLTHPQFSLCHIFLPQSTTSNPGFTIQVVDGMTVDISNAGGLVAIPIGHIRTAALCCQLVHHTSELRSQRFAFMLDTNYLDAFA